MPSRPLLKRRWMQFSLRGLLFATLIAAVGLGTLTPAVRRANQQRAVLAMVEKYGGQVRYDFEDPQLGTGTPRRHPATNRRLRKLLGDDFFDRVVAVEIRARSYSDLSASPPALNDDEFRQITALSELRILKIDESRLTDEGAGRVSWLVNLEELRLTSPFITDRTLEAIARLPKLRRLCLMSPQITDAAIDTIGSMKDLQQVNLTGTRVTREGLNRLHQLLPKTWVNH